MRLIDYDKLEEYAVEYQERHEHDGGQLTRGEFKLIDSFMFECPKTEAIPVEWLREKMFHGEPDESKTAWRTLKMWEREQEAR